MENIIGTSMGAIIGGLYCYGYTPSDILDMTKEFKALKLLTVFKPSFNISGLVDGDGVLNYFIEKTKGIPINQCKINFAAIAFDLNQTKTIIIDKGALANAMRASSSLPLIFEPFTHGKYLFIDGYIEHPLPLKFADYYHKNLMTVAVSVLPPLPVKSDPIEEIDNTPVEQDIPGMISIFLKSTLYNQASMSLESLLAAEPELYISAYAPELGFMDVDEAQEFYETGKLAAEKAVKEYIADKDNKAHTGFMKNLNEKYRELKLYMKSVSE